MPVSFANVFRVFVTLVLAAHVFYMYSVGRAVGETFGVNWFSIITSAMFALVMLIPLVWAVTIPQVPEIYLRHVRPRRWWTSGRCAACGYRLEGLKTQQCPECGAAIRPPHAYHIGTHTIALFVALNLLAWVLGCAVGEMLIQFDEYQFRAEVERRIQINDPNPYFRSRLWPLHDSGLVYVPGEGIRAQD